MPTIADLRRTWPCRAFALALLSAAAACADRGGPVGPPGVRPDPSTPALLQALDCSADLRVRTVRCGLGTLPANARGYVIVGGQHQYVEVTAGGLSFNAGTGTYTFTVTVENLIPQPLGTRDGVAADSGGVKLVFASGPTAAGGGTATVAGDGTGTFTAGGQPFYKYAGGALGADGILSQNETSSARGWQINTAGTVTSVTFQLYVVAEVPHPQGYIDVTPAADTLVAGGTAPLAATVRSVVGEPVAGQTITWGTSDAGVATVNAGTGAVTAVAPGSVTITATAGARSGSATLQVCPSLAVGGVYVADMPAGANLCLAGGASGAEYTVVPVNLADSATATVSTTGSGIVPTSGAPTPFRAAAAVARPAGPELDDFGMRLRERDRQALARMIPGARAAYRNRAAGRVRRAITPGVPAVGALMSLNVNSSNQCSTFDTRTGRVMAVGTRVIVMADTANPSGGLTAAAYQAFADSFDTFVYPVATANFGTPTDLDSNGGRVIAFFTRAVNELTPPGSPSYVGGFFMSRDLFPITACPTSNYGEIFYLLAADPSGVVNGNARSVSFVTQHTVATLAHEFEHMINAERRLYVNQAEDFEEIWLDEGLAHVAEELVFYDRAGLAPGANIGTAVFDGGVKQDAFFTYEESNFGRLRQWLLSPGYSGGFRPASSLAMRGASWAFLRYAADRKGGSQQATWNALVNSTTTGTANLQAVLGADPRDWYRDFAGALYADDAGLSPPATYSMASWNFRAIYAALDYDPGPSCSCAYELAASTLANGVASPQTLAGGGGAAYLRMGVTAGAFASVSTRAGGVAPAATVRMVVIRRK